MIWDVLFWLALVYLAASIIWHFFLRGFRKSSRMPSGKDDHDKAPGGGRSWTHPAAAILVLALSFVMKANPDLFKPEMTTEARAELGHFVEAIALYEQASALVASTEKPGYDAWESINALLQASLQEAEQISDPQLEKLHPDLKEHFRDEFMTGLNSGIFGLRFYTGLRAKGVDTIERDMQDSLEVGRELLARWTNWYQSVESQIRAEIE